MQFLPIAAGSSCSCLLCPGVVLSSATTSCSLVCYDKPRLLLAQRAVDGCVQQQGGVGSCGSEPFRHLSANSQSAWGEPCGCKK